MDFTLSTEHVEFRRMLRRFFETEAPTNVISQFDRNEEYPARILNKLAELGLWGICISEEFGGSRTDSISVCILCEEVQRAGGCIAFSLTPTATFCAPGIERFGNQAMKHRLLPGMAAGTIRMAIGLTEPNAGSDLSHIATSAKIVDDNFVIKGQKIWTSGADTADFIFLLVRTDYAVRGHRGLSVVLVPRDLTGVTIRKIPKLAGQGTHTCEVFFDSVRVPISNLVGELGAGAKIVFSLLDTERIFAAAQSMGMAQGAFDLAFAHARDRIQFDVPIIDHQAISHMIADMATEIEMGRLLMYCAAWKHDQGDRCSLEAAMAKVACTEIATSVANRGMQVLGGYSYSLEYAMERYYRETKLFEIAAGTNQIMRNIITKELKRGRSQD